jgi:hypothetical protein
MATSRRYRMQVARSSIKEQHMIHSLRRRTGRLMLAGVATTLASLVLAGGAMADPPSSTGTFVIGDENAAIGSQVTFWGSQWWQDNPLSTGLAPASFKGFAENATATCGQNWTTDPGNSSHPPATLSGTIPVIVSSQITKSGPVISGDTTEVVMVSVDPGYAGDPGHPGTGIVVGIVCGGGGQLA